MVAICIKNQWNQRYPHYYNECIDSHHFIDLEFICANGLKCFAHQLVFARFSPLLANIIQTLHQRVDVITILVPQFQRKTVRLLIKFLYTGTVNLGNKKQLGVFTDLLDAFEIDAPVDELTLDVRGSKVKGGLGVKGTKREIDLTEEVFAPPGKKIKHEVVESVEEDMKKDVETLEDMKNSEGMLSLDDFLSIANVPRKEMGLPKKSTPVSVLPRKSSPVSMPSIKSEVGSDVTVKSEPGKRKLHAEFPTTRNISLPLNPKEAMKHIKRTQEGYQERQKTSTGGNPIQGLPGHPKKVRATKKPRKTNSFYSKLRHMIAIKTEVI